uniref:Uncharacterized protein n=1 Tax=Panagrolaimus sp. ES5 TaxID=591445 RepID=A0AC34GWU4_9BILA
MGSPTNWYTKFLSTRCVPPLFYGETGSSSDCYALTIKLAEFRELPTGENYRIKMCFFDTQYKVFFGRQFTSKLLIGNEKKILIDEQKKDDGHKKSKDDGTRGGAEIIFFLHFFWEMMTLKIVVFEVYQKLVFL